MTTRQRLMAVAGILPVALLTGCGGPTRLYSNPPAQISQSPQRLLVVHSVRNPNMFATKLTEDLTACGVASTLVNGTSQSKEKLRTEAKKAADAFRADYALEITIVSTESDNMGPRANNYRIILTDLSNNKEVWSAHMMLAIRRIKGAGTEKDVADDLVWGMADSKILSDCPPRPSDKS